MSDQPSSRAIASLVCGILAFTACPLIGGILAVVLGLGEPSPVGKAGVVLGWIHLALCTLGLLVAAAFLLLALLIGNA